MTTLTPNTIDTMILPNFDRKLRDNIFMSTSAFEYLYKQIEEVDGGSHITEQIAYLSSPNADNFAGGISELPATFVGNTTAAMFVPCYYFYSIAIPDTTVILNEGEGMIIDIIGAQYATALMSLNNVLGKDIYGDGSPRNGAPTLSGLGAIVTNGADPAGGAYGGISRIGSSGTFKAPTGNAPWWNAVTLNMGSTATQDCWKGTFQPAPNGPTLSFSAIIQLLTATTVGQYAPEVCFCDNNAWVALFNLLTPTVRTVEITEFGRMGFKGLSVANTIFVQDDQCPSNTIFTVNNLLKFRPWRGGFFRQLPWRTPPTQLVNIKYGLLIANMVHSRPNTMGKLYNIAAY